MYFKFWSDTNIMRKRPYLGPKVPNPKSKGTLFSSKLKVGENKVPLLFRFGAPGPRYGRFLITYCTYVRDRTGGGLCKISKKN